MKGRNKEAVKIAEEIIKGIENAPYSVSNIRKFYRLVEMLRIESDVEWINKELYGYLASDDLPNYRLVQYNRHKSTPIMYGYEVLKNFALSGKILCYNPLISTDVFLHVLGSIDNRVYKSTSEILSQLKFQKIESDIFEETRKLVDKELSELCPIVFEKLTEIYEDAIESKSRLDTQQVALGCRAVLNDFADAIYKPSTEKFKDFDGKEHPLTEDKYMNRIMAFVQNNTDSETNQDFMKSHIQYLFSFLENVNKLANKGTHKGIPKEQASRCVIYTYLALGDIINLCSVKMLTIIKK